MPRRRACASPRLEQEPTSKYFFWRGDHASTSQDLNLQVSQVAGAALERANRNVHRAEEVNGVLPQFVIPHLAFFRLADNNHFLLLELVDTVYAALLDAVCAHFLTEARRIAGQGLRKGLLIV